MDVNLVLFKKDGSQKVFPLPSNVAVIGRRHNCDLCIPLTPISRRHCQLNHDEKSLKIRDLESRNGTYLNGKRIKEATIQPGDYVKVGPLTFLFQIDGRPEEISPPTEATPSTPNQETSDTQLLTDEESDSFIELDGSGSFGGELGEDI